MSPGKIQSLWHEDKLRTAVRIEPLIPTAGAELFIASHSLISIGTERLVAMGEIPSELHIDMEVPYMSGDLTLPVKYGYSMTGHFEGNDTLFHVMHPHQSVCSVDPDDCYEVPQGIPARRATLASNLETALNAIWDARLCPGERVLVVGFGMIGSLVARIASRIAGVDLQVYDTDSTRSSFCSEMGFSNLDPDVTAILPFDVAFHTSATAVGLQQCLDLVGREGRVVELSWYGRRATTLKLGGEFHSLRKRLISSQVSTIPAHMRARWDFRRRKQKVFELLADPAFDKHITHTVTLQEAAELFNRWRNETPEGLGYCIQYR